jgi:hypothetical protein
MKSIVNALFAAIIIGSMMMPVAIISLGMA